MKFIITEEEKKHIKKLYGLITEQTNVSNVVIPNDILEYTPEQFKEWYDNNVKPFEDVVLRKMVKNRISSKPDLLLADGIRSITKTSEDKANFKSLLQSFNTPEGEREMIVLGFEIAQNIANEVYSKWDESLKKNMVLTINKETKTVDGESVGGTIEFPIEWNPDTNIQLYVNNEWELTPESIESFNSNVVNKINLLKQQFPNVVVSLLSLDIKTSASRYRNTGKAEDLTFQELSGYRNNFTKDFIINALQENGVSETDTVTPTQEYLGSNGDGTTGPNPPEPNAYVNGGNVKMNTTPTEPRNQYGEPHATPEEYNQYKYLKVTIKLKATLPTEQTTQDRITIFSYKLDIDGTIIPPPTPVKLKPKPKGKSIFMNFLNKAADLLSIDPEKCAAYASGGN